MAEIVIPSFEEEETHDLFAAACFTANDPFQPLSAAHNVTFSRPTTPRKASLSSVHTARQHKTTASASSSFNHGDQSFDSSHAPSLPLSASQTRQAKVVAQVHAPLEVGLYMVLDTFFEKAEQKISDILGRPIEHEVYLPPILGEGVDPAFDKLLDSIAFISRKLPRMVIDLVMRWRKTQGEGIDETAYKNALATSPNPTNTRSAADVLNDRKSFSSIYILCRALSAVVSSAAKDSLGDDLGSKLEDIIYNSLKNADPLLVERSANRKANMDFYAKIMGLLSHTRFISVSDRFVQDLNKLNIGNTQSKEDARAEHLVRGMRFLKLQIYPLELFEEAAEFLGNMAEIFEAASGARLKMAIANTLTTLLEPIIATTTAEVNHPLWARAITSIHTKALALVAKPRYLSVALPLLVAATAASPEDFLLANFQPALDICLAKCKEKNTKMSAIYGMIQLLWAYIRKCHEPHTHIAKRLDPILKFIFPPGRKQLNPLDIPLQYAACIPHIILHHHFELGSEILASLLNPQPAISTDRWPIDVLAYERMHVAIRALLLTLDTLENGKVPTLPPAPVIDMDGSVSLAELNNELILCAVAPLSSAFANRGHIKNLIASSSTTIARIAMACDRACDSFTILDERNVIQRGPPPQPNSPERDLTCYRRHGAFMVFYPRDKQPLFDLLRVSLDSWPRLLVHNSFGDFRPLDILLRALLHVDIDVYMSARKTLERLTKLKDGHLVIKALGRFVVRPELLLRENGSLQGANIVKLESLVLLWNELVLLYLDQVLDFNKMQHSGPATHHRHATSTSESADHPLGETEPRTVWPILVELEAVSMVLICSQSALVRRRATEVLKMCCKFQKALIEWSNAVSGTPISSSDERLSDILDSAGAMLLNEMDDEMLSAAEKSRLQMWKRLPEKEVILKVIDSDTILDVNLWHHLLAPCYSLWLESLPTQTQLARSLLAARLLKVYPSASSVANLVPNKVPQTPSTVKSGGVASPLYPMDVAFLADHLKTHLMALCAIATNSNPAVSAKAPEPGSQLDSERLNSGPEIVRLAVPFLASDNMALREAVVRSLGCVNVATYKSLLEGLNSILRHLVEDHKNRHQQYIDPRSGAPRRSMRHSRLQLSVARVHELSSRLLRHNTLTDTEYTLIGQYIKEALLFVSDPEIVEDSVTLALRRAFCVCVLNFTEHGNQHGSINQFLSVEVRHQLFALFDGWSFRPSSAASPDVSRTGPSRSVDGHPGHHHTKSRTSSVGSQSQNNAIDVFLPAANAIAALCEHDGIIMKREHNDQRPSLEPTDLLRWAQALFESQGSLAHAVGRRSIGGLIATNLDNRMFLDAAVYSCFGEPDSLLLQQSTFSVLSGALIAESNIAVKSSTAICLALWKLGQADLPTKQRALDVITTKLSPDLRERIVKIAEPAIYSTFTGAALQARIAICGLLASTAVVDARSVFLELAIRTLQIGTKQTRLLMQLLPAWLTVIQLPPIDLSDENAVATDSVLANLFLLSAKYGDVYQNEIKAMWKTLIIPSPTDSKTSNLSAVLRFLIDETYIRGSKEFTRHAQKIIGSLCEQDMTASILTALGQLLQPATIVVNVDDSKVDLSKASSRRTNLDTLFPITSRRMLMGSSQAVLLLAGDAVINRLDTADPNILRFFHVLVMHADHPTLFIRTQSRDILVRMLTLLQKLEKVQLYNSTQTNAIKMAGPAEVLWSWRQFWEHSDQDASAENRRTILNMRRLVEDALKLFEKRIPDVRRLWGIVALEWANACPLRHVACRSLQAFRLLSPPTNQRMLAEMVSRLSNTLCDDNPDAQLYAREILNTLFCVAEYGATSLMEDLPQLWWTVVACTQTNREEELETTLLFAILLIKRINMYPSSVAGIVETCPKAMQDRIRDTLGAAVRAGFRSSATVQTTWTFVRTLITAQHAYPLTQPYESLHMIYGAVLIHGLHYLEEGNLDADFEVVTEAVAKTAAENKQESLARVMRSLGKNRFRTREDLLQQSMGAVKEDLDKRDQLEVFLLFLGTLQNALPWIRLRCLALLKHFARQIQLQESDVETLGGDLLAPLLRLLSQPDMASAALEVLDEPIPLGRAKTANSSSTNTRNGPSQSKSCFGSVHATGWSCPNPLAYLELARSNLRDVVATCGTQTTASPAASPFAFANEDPMSGPEGYFDTFTQSDKEDVSTLGDMVSALHDLGSFFEEEGGPNAAFRLSQSVGSASRVAAVLARSHKSSHSHHARTGSMAAIPETPTPFSAAFAENPRDDIDPESLRKWNGFQNTSSDSLQTPTEEDTTAGSDDSSFDSEKQRKRMNRFWKAAPK